MWNVPFLETRYLGAGRKRGGCWHVLPPRPRQRRKGPNNEKEERLQARKQGHLVTLNPHYAAHHLSEAKEKRNQEIE